MSFALWAVACAGIPQAPPATGVADGMGCAGQSTGKSGAQVALPQSPILRIARAEEHLKADWSAKKLATKTPHAMKPAPQGRVILNPRTVGDFHPRNDTTYARLLANDRLVSLTEQGEIAYWRIGVRALFNHLTHRTNASLAPTERIRYLNEDPETAYIRYCEAERKRGRTPLPRDFGRIDYR